MKSYLAVPAIPSIPFHFDTEWSVCLSSVCHTLAPCLNHLTNLDAIWQVGTFVGSNDTVG